ncbi:hypothetical protein GcC1_015025 [Golovinomyces cichoracearum]|uniref:Uncharacterized protein n=1 Tax=Golovinomyces cichoracearum TaxID=62708 RepID=A0A420J6K9_9PEZI|nr:hypothetical protein GcC1_015025 [Golovinomyces cichoracearum]
MPYNTSAIIPSEEPTGTTQLPFSRVKKIIATDQDIQIMSNAGAFVITLATLPGCRGLVSKQEMFIQHLAQEALKVVKSERKPRRNIQYRDLATAISNHENLEFLVDIVPNTTTFKQVKEKKTLSSSTDQSQTQEPRINDSIVANEIKYQETSVGLTSEFCGDQITTTGKNAVLDSLELLEASKTLAGDISMSLKFGQI